MEMKTRRAVWAEVTDFRMIMTYDHDVLILDLSGKLYENVKKADEKTLSGTNTEGLDTLKVGLNENFLRIFF